MDKKFIFPLALAFLIFSLTFASAGWFDQAEEIIRHNTKFEKKTEWKNEWDDGYEKITTTFKEEREYEKRNTANGPSYATFRQVPPSSWRYKAPYSYKYYSSGYHDKYNDYYYSPRYDPYLEHYNWGW